MKNVMGAIRSGGYADGAFYLSGSYPHYPQNFAAAGAALCIAASRSSSIYGGASTVQPQSLQTQYLIKY